MLTGTTFSMLLPAIVEAALSVTAGPFLSGNQVRRLTLISRNISSLLT